MKVAAVLVLVQAVVCGFLLLDPPAVLAAPVPLTAMIKRDVAQRTDDCSTYCDATYPEHTYPNADNHNACERGCRVTQMVAVLSWPLPADQKACRDACLEGYDVGSEGAYACLVGCSASSLATNPDDTTTILRSEDYLSYANMDLSGSLYLILVPSSDDSGFVNLLGTDDGFAVVYYVPKQELMLVTYDSSQYYEAALNQAATQQHQQANYREHLITPEQQPDYGTYCPWQAIKRSSLASVGFFLCVMVLLALTGCCLCGEDDPKDNKTTTISSSSGVGDMAPPLPDKKGGPLNPMQVFLPMHLSATDSKVEGVLTVM